MLPAPAPNVYVVPLKLPGPSSVQLTNDFVDVTLAGDTLPVFPLSVIVYPTGGIGSGISVVVP